jgi:hypothetical protein
MFFRRFWSAKSDSPRQFDLDALGAAVDQFGDELGRHRSSRKAGQSRSVPARLSSLPPYRPRIDHPHRLPIPYRRGQPRTALSLMRDQYGRPWRLHEPERRAEGFLARLRRQLLGLRGALRRLRDRFRRRRPLPPGVGSRRPRIRHSSVARRSSDRDGFLTALVLAVTAALGFEVVSARKAAIPIDPPPAVGVDAVHVPDLLEVRIEELAQAIAAAEGYFAEGLHDGRTLPHRLNNPGALKKPALGAADLPTWKDTGIVEFPTTEMGWAALRHQVRLMLTGTSGIYAHSDSLSSVGEKYAEGDVNWGVNVATKLGVPPARTLAELAPRE